MEVKFTSLSSKAISPAPLKALSSEAESLSFPSSEPTKQQQLLPLRIIPGDYGLPFFGAIKDRLEYFYSDGGRNEFFRSRQQKYNSTIFRANMPPGPFVASDPKVIVLLDGKSFPVLFDLTKVEKKDLFTGTYMPSTNLTGGYRILSYLDPSEPKHEKLKHLIFFLLKSRSNNIIPQFHSNYTDLFDSLDRELSKNGKASFSGNDQTAFTFLCRAFYGTDPKDTSLGSDGPSLVQKWVLFNLSPELSLGLPKFIEDPILHTFRLPSIFVKSDYKRLYDFFYGSAGFVLEEAERQGISRDEACHNILFATCFNTFGGVKIFFPALMKWIGGPGNKELHSRLAQEIRSAVKSNGGEVTIATMEEMPLMKSVVYETFRIDPPVPLQYAKAKQDMVIENHENSFQVKKGEMLFGFQPFATKDPKIFERAEEFVGDRFLGEEGEKLLKYVLWSNGPETESPSVRNKQCPGKDFVVLVSRLLVVEMFLRYDSFEVEATKSALGYDVNFISLAKATS
ncbi:allene oxide synthase-like [Arachis stenosperma]|uniref:allene oxide synthase-like n=1 Tax=Arachis stenosperma TaxID=217475 RepID=UPI0025ACAD81|nr:allene oxide synthase-like [Arachis stenosperma]